MFKFLMYTGIFLWAVWQTKGYILLALLLLFTGGCSPNAYAYPIGKLAEDKVIMIEKSSELEKEFDHLVFSIPDSHCGTKSKETIPYPEEPFVCYTFANDAVECDWLIDNTRGRGLFMSYLWDDSECQWHYLFNYWDYI